jgi:1-acyl-sn-glycerol-3-phosphate acyltransferase
MNDREPPFNLLMYHLFKWSIVAPTFYGIFQGRIYGRENVPKRGAFVVVSNHASDFDPPLLSNCVGRPVAFMAKEELFKIPILKQAIQLYGAYPVKRGQSDRQAIRDALRFLDQGWATGIFLQGTRTLDGKITEPKLGAMLIAAKAQVPILPACLWGTHAILPKGATRPNAHPVTVRFGELIPPPQTTDREELEQLSHQCKDIINQLHSLGR